MLQTAQSGTLRFVENEHIKNEKVKVQLCCLVLQRALGLLSPGMYKVGIFLFLLSLDLH